MTETGTELRLLCLMGKFNRQMSDCVVLLTGSDPAETTLRGVEDFRRDSLCDRMLVSKPLIISKLRAAIPVPVEVLVTLVGALVTLVELLVMVTGEHTGYELHSIDTELTDPPVNNSCLPVD